MATGVTKTGFAYEVSDDIGDDYELLELICDAEENEALSPKVIRYVLGAKQMHALKKHVKNKNGFVSTAAMSAEVADVFNAIAQLKNS